MVQKGESFGEPREERKMRWRINFERRIGKAGAICGRKP
jgi:hypothetical protein